MHATLFARRALLYLGRGEEAAAAVEALLAPGRAGGWSYLDVFRGVSLAYAGREDEARAALERFLAAHDVAAE